MLCLMHLIHHVVHTYIKNSKKKKKKRKKEKRPFGLGALGLQIISIYFQKIGLGALGLFINIFSKNPFCSFKDYKIFPKPPFQRLQNFFKSLLFKRIQDDPFGKVSSKS